MLGYGQNIDLYKLLTVVEGKGGFEAVCNGGLWDLVGEECGLGVSVGSSVKLAFDKYKSVLESFVKKSGGCKVSDESGLMGFEIEDKGLLSSEQVKGGVDGANVVKSLNSDSSLEKGAQNGGCVDSGMTNRGMVSEGNGDAVKVAEDVGGGKTLAETAANVSGAVKSDEPGLVNVGESLKRKRDSLVDLLGWFTRTAKNPCDPEIGSLPEKWKWKAYNNQEAWKRVLLYREAVFHKKQSSNEQQNWQSQKMHPYIYDVAPTSTTYNLRQRVKRGKKCSFENQKPASQSSSDSSQLAGGDSDRTTSPDDEKKCILVGPDHQAEVPEWTGPIPESDPKWLGTQVWPSVAATSRFLIERDPIGKGRQDSCGCAVSGSVECVKFHISERKAKVKLELGVAFYHWHFDKIGEDVQRLWTDDDEKKFREVVRSNPPSSERYFWDHIFQTFPNKSRETLVSYYFNVYLLQRRAYHNRHTPDNIDSDDDESQSALRNVFGHQTQNLRDSILLTPKKRAKKGK